MNTHRTPTMLFLGTLAFVFVLLQSCDNSNKATDDHPVNAQSESNKAEKPCTPDPKLSVGAALLFGCVETAMTIEERNQLFEVSGLRVTADSKFLTEKKEKGDFFPSQQCAHVADINKDGVEEVLIIHGNHELYNGRAGRPLELYIKQKSGKYQEALKTFGIDVIILNTLHNGFPDIVPGEGGLEFGVYHYDGKKYKRKGRIKDGDLEGISMVEMAKSHIAAWN